MLIKVVYRSIDGVRVARSFKTLKGARKFAHKYVGADADLGSSYAVSFDGVGKVEVFGARIKDLFGDEDPNDDPNPDYPKDTPPSPGFYYDEDGPHAY